MDEQKVPYIVFEGEQARHERTVKRFIVALIISVLLLLVYKSQETLFRHL